MVGIPLGGCGETKRTTSPTWHRKLRSKRSKARRFVRKLKAATYLPRRQRTRLGKAAVLLHGSQMGGWGQGKGKSKSPNTWQRWTTWPKQNKTNQNKPKDKENKGKTAEADGSTAFPSYESLQRSSSSSSSATKDVQHLRQEALEILQSKDLQPEGHLADLLQVDAMAGVRSEQKLLNTKTKLLSRYHFEH